MSPRTLLAHARGGFGALRRMIRPPRDNAARGGDNWLALMRDLQAAMRDDTLELHYQPKLRAREGGVDSAEALLRWPHPARAIPSIDVVVRAAEATGNIRALTEWVIGRAIADQARLAARDHTLAIHVNLSGGLLHDRGFAAWALARVPQAAGTIGFEITETMMIADPDGALANLQAFADAGIRLAIDDYGTGYSSLAYLQRLPIHELKIDRTFVSRLTHSHRDPLLIRSTIDLAHALGMDVTAEGVEAPEALALLQVMGCDLVQGYLLSHPLPLEGLVQFLDRGAGDAGEARASLAVTTVPNLRHRRLAGVAVADDRVA